MPGPKGIVIKHNSCVRVSIPNIYYGTSVTRTRCPVWYIKGSFDSNGLNHYTFEDIAILRDEDGYCLLENGHLERNVYAYNYNYKYYSYSYRINREVIPRCKQEDRRAPFTDCIYGSKDTVHLKVSRPTVPFAISGMVATLVAQYSATPVLANLSGSIGHQGKGIYISFMLSKSM